MSSRVLSTDAAKQAITKMQNIISGPFIEQIRQLNAQGVILCDRNNWDGRLADEFRRKWPDINSALNKTQQELEELRAKVKQINDNIMQAGGNA